MRRQVLLLVLGVGVLATASTASPAPGAQVPSFTLQRLQARFGDMTYLPTRLPLHYRYERWRTVDGKLVVDFKHRTGEDRFSFQVERLPAATPCDLGGAFHRTLQMAGNKIYYGGWGGEWIAWRCVTSPTTGIRYVLGVHSRGTLPDVALARVDAPASASRAPRRRRSRLRAVDNRPVASILDTIGNTPLVRLRRCAPPNGAELWVKLESRNPSGSMKDRMALAMIEGAERDGLIAPGDTVVEYTGGSTGPALALVCRAKGYGALIVMADCFTEERFQLMRALGAEVDVVQSVEGRPRVTPQDIRNMVARAAELAARPGHYATDQFNNPYVVPDHRERLGREIWEQTEGRVTAFCHGLGTAGSLMGVSDALRPHGVFVQAHEPASSAAIGGGAPGPFLIQGWAGFVMPLWDPDRVDHVEPIADDEAVEMTLRLSREEGIFAGISSGANVVGAHRLAERLGPDAVIVTLVVDTGFKYLSVSPFLDL